MGGKEREMKQAFYLMSTISNIGLTIGLIFFVTVIYSAIKKEPLYGNEKKSFIKGIQCVLFISLIFTLITNPVVNELIGNNDIRIKPNGTYCYLVEIENHYIPAQVLVVTEETDFDDYGPVGEGYYIQKIFINEDQHIDFYYKDVPLNKSYPIDDESDNTWRVKLLNQHIQSPLVKETTSIHASKIFYLCMSIFLILFSIIYIFVHRRDLIRVDDLQ